MSFNTSTCTTARYSYYGDAVINSGTHLSPGWPDANSVCWTSHSAALGQWTAQLVPGITYTVTVQVIDQAGQSASATVTFTTLPA